MTATQELAHYTDEHARLLASMRYRGVCMSADDRCDHLMAITHCERMIKRLGELAKK